jgi:hypothetical protein
MSEPGASETDRDRESQAEIIEETEILDGVPVLAGTPRILPAESSAGTLPVEHRAPTVIPAVQAAAVAAGGFVAGAAVVGLVHRRRRRSTALVKGRGRGARALKGSARREGRAGELLQIVGSRSLLVDLHLLGGAGTDS